MTHIPDWTQDGITQKYLDWREPKKCRYCGEDFIGKGDMCEDCIAENEEEDFYI